MPHLANPRWEKFATGLADGLKQIDAYEMAGYPRSSSAASQLANKPEIQARVHEIIEDRQRVADQQAKDDPDSAVEPLTRDWIIRMLQENVRLAQKAGQLAPANKAIEILAAMHGVNLKPPVKVDPNKDDEKEEDTFDPADIAKAFEKLENALPPTKGEEPEPVEE